MKSTTAPAHEPRNTPPPTRLVRQVVVTITVLFGVAMIIRARVTPACWDEKTDALSPDSQHIAHNVVHTCEGPFARDLSFTQFIDMATVGTGQRIKVFESESASTEMHWIDGNQLSIDIGSKSTVTLSLHDANGVRITYHVPKKLMNRRTERMSGFDDGKRVSSVGHQRGYCR